MGRTGFALPLFVAAGVLVASACAHDDHAMVAPVSSLPPASSGATASAFARGAAVGAPALWGEGALPAGSAPLQYLIADPLSRSAALGLTPLDSGLAFSSSGVGAFGLIVDGTRVVARGASIRRALDVTEPPMLAAQTIPAWLGGGFLFRSRTALYVSAQFEGELRPLATFPSEIEEVAFGPTSALVHGELGERWALDLATGARVAPQPLAVSAVGALADGRAAALTERGAAFVSTDGGAHWSDVSSQLARPADEIAVVGDTLWIVLSSGPSFRVEPGGALATFDKANAAKPTELRARDARWHNDEAPLRRALRVGVPLDDGTALLVADGDLVRVSLSTGELASVAPSHLPPDMACDAVRTADDVLLVCSKPAGNGGALVASHAGNGGVPIVEQTFSASGQFYAADDGSLVFGGPCSRAKASRFVACVRGPGGVWQELDVEPFLTADGGPPLDVLRWVPRPDGDAVGLLASVGGSGGAAIDARTGDVRPWQVDGLTAAMRNALTESRSRGTSSSREGARLVDHSWTWTPAGGLRAWGDGGAVLDVAPDGVASASPYFFDRVATAGPFAFARTRDGRAWQSVDRGASWGEVAAPITTTTTTTTTTTGVAARASTLQEPRFCSAVGCDLASWYRIGWNGSTSTSTPPPFAVVAPAPPHVARTQAVTLTCKTLGEPKVTVLSRSDSSPEDLGLGATRLPAGNDDVEYARQLFFRTVPNPVHEVDVSSDSDYPAARAVVHGRDLRNLAEDTPGYAQRLLALRSNVTYVAPFDPSAPVRRATLSAADVAAAARGAGLRAVDVLSPDLLTVLAFVPVTPLDPSAPGDLAFVAEGGLLGVLRGGGSGSAPSRARFGARLHATDETKLVSAVALAGDEYAVLEVGENGVSEVRKIGAAGVTDLFDVAPIAGAISYPANPDALAVGPHGEVVLVRVRSASEPPSAFEPALLFGPAGATSALAPWSTLTPADDAACKADMSGYRVTVHAVGAWVQIAGIDTHAHEEAVMLARVKWSTTRACLEALEVRVGDTRITVPQRGSSGRRSGATFDDAAATVVTQAVESFVVARFAGGAQASRVGIVPGIESRAPLQCTIGP